MGLPNVQLSVVLCVATRLPLLNLNTQLISFLAPLVYVMSKGVELGRDARDTSLPISSRYCVVTINTTAARNV